LQIKVIALFVIGLVLGFGLGYSAMPLLAPSPGATTTTTGKTEITIGGLFCTSGDAAAYGQDIQASAQIAIDDLNTYLQSEGSNYHFTLVSEDTADTAEGSLKGITDLYQTKGITAFVGPGNSVEVGGLKAFSDANKLVVVAISSSDEYRINDYIFRPFVINGLTAPPIADLIYAEGYRKVGGLYRDDSFGTDLFNIFAQEFQRLGGTVQGVKYTINLPDYASEVAQLSSIISGFGADDKTAVFHVTFEADGLNIYGHASTDPVLSKVKWFGTTDSMRDAFLPPKAPTAIGDFLVKVDSTGLFPTSPVNPTYQKFAAEYKAKTGNAATGWGSNMYDLAWILGLALVHTGGKTGDVLKTAVYEVTTHYIGSSGWKLVDQNGDLAVADFGVWHVTNQGGQYKYDFIKYYSGTSGQFTPWISGKYT
jgi:branched-chain amino acid transport system substrate-binding protein